MSGVHRIKAVECQVCDEGGSGECQVCYEGSHLGSAGRHLDYLHFPPAVVPVGVGGAGAASEHGLLSVPVTHGLEPRISRGYNQMSHTLKQD